MTEHTLTNTDPLETLEGIRAAFEARQQASGKGFHALGEEVLSAYFRASEALPRPASAMTFRNFLQGKTTLRDPTALELYFRALGATDQEMRTIRATLQQALDRRLVSSRGQASQGLLGAFDLETLPYSRALIECEVMTKLEGSLEAPLTHLTPREYLLGPDGQRDAGPEPERWGLIQHLDDLAGYLERLDQALIERVEGLPRQATRKRQLLVCADLREVASAYAHWLLYRPRGGELLFSRRRYMLHGLFPAGQREVAVALAKRVARILYACLERVAKEVILPGKSADRLSNPKAECALECAAEQGFAMVNSFYASVVQGSLGTSAMYQAVYQLRRTNRDASDDWSEVHEELLQSYARAVDDANRAIEHDVRVPYGTLKRIYDEQFEQARGGMARVWEQTYAPRVTRHALSLLVSELHRALVLRDKEFVKLSGELFTGAHGRDLLQAHNPKPLYERLG